ncbi:MAG: TrbG/VirB9 family P-type conjugative transfer protein [Alphaproteobacteria bacterium]|jgi:hypothetical protein|nr:TrbG/VirB9 family P-type conjugative transfer protein [Alphaproteobacteria bacterium]
MSKVINILLIILVCIVSVNLKASNEWIESSTFNTKEIFVKKGMVTTIQFSSIINYFVVGDELIADVENINSNTLLISPKLPKEKTNINVSTKDGNFVFMINTLDYEDNSQEPNLHISVGKLAFNNQTKLEKQLLNQEKEKAQNPDFDYDFNMYSKRFCGFWFCDYKKIAPSKVWTDGQYTYLDYTTDDGTLRTIPNVQEVVDDIDIPVNKVIKDNVIVVQTLAKKITIVANGAFVCIEYKGGKYEIK